jgi:8-oxo-dGTP pyrophosphatase MutT (NUDIX family)
MDSMSIAQWFQAAGVTLRRLVTRPPPIDRILAAFDQPEPARPGAQPAGLSAVLLALYDLPGGPALLYEKRSSSMRSHPGEVSFPGGAVEPGDEGARAAALREAREEVGIDAARVRDVRHLVDYVTFRGTTVVAFVARVDDAPPRAPASLDEVESVFAVPLDTLLDPALYEARRMEGSLRRGRIHYWHLPEATMWGITGELTAIFLEKACGWVPPPEVRIVSDLSDIVPRRS